MGFAVAGTVVVAYAVAMRMALRAGATRAVP